MKKPLLTGVHWRFGTQASLLVLLGLLASGDLLAAPEPPVAVRATNPAAFVVTGVVTDDQGEGLPGVTVLLKSNTRIGATTDARGKYTIDAGTGTATLVFSSIGFETLEVPVENRSTVDIRLVADTKNLSEVVVVGYGTQKKANLTGAVSTIDSKVIENRPSTNLATALQGTSPGLIIQRGTGQPGNEGINLQIRGVTTANGNVPPLVVLDGVTVPSSVLTTMNPNDVESISVLKDAAAAAIYGAQAAGGVILVTTKRGKAGKVTFDVLAQQGTDWATNVPDRMSLLEEAEFSNLARRNSGSAPEYTDLDLDNIRNNVPYIVNPNDTGTYIFYNQEPLTDQILRKYTSMQTYNVSARGGSDKFNFLVSAGYYGKKGVFKLGPDQVRRYNFRVNLGAQLTKHLNLDTRVAFTREGVDQSSAGVDGEGLLYQIYRLRTRTPFFTPEGRYNGAGSAATAYAWLEAGGYNKLQRNNLDGVFTLTASNFVKGLTLTARAGTQYYRDDRRVFNRTVPLWGKSRILSYLNQINAYRVENGLTQGLNLQYLAQYDFKLGERHNFNVLAGYQWEEYRRDLTVTAANNLVSNDLPTLNLGDDRTKSNSQDIRTRAFQSVFGRFNYNYADRYLLEATIRRDESSILAPGLRSKVFPSASAGWNIHREAFWSVPAVTEFKVRGSWGRLGGALGDALGFYDYLGQLSRNNNLVLGDQRTSYIFQGSIPSSSLSWEDIETFDVGADLGFFQNKLTLNFDYYVKYNRNMLTAQQLPATIGVGTPRINNGELKSWGFETELNFRDRIGKDFTYQIGLNVSDNQNRLINFSGRNVVSAGGNNTIEGYPLSTIWGYQTDGYFTSADEVKNWAFQDNRTGAGDVRYVDRNGDKLITVGKGTTADVGDLVLLGTTNPRWLFGGTFSAQWKGFDVSIFIQGVGKRSLLPNLEGLAPLLVTWKQALGIHRDYWTPENPDAIYPRPFTGGTHNYRQSDKWVLDVSYARVKNLQFGYTLPSSLTQRIGLARTRIFFSGQDLFTITGLGPFKKYYDPEQRPNVQNDYPFFATASVGLNVSF
jgi:TonB-linked SusC/RagA family outer membrane protein